MCKNKSSIISYDVEADIVRNNIHNPDYKVVGTYRFRVSADSKSKIQLEIDSSLKQYAKNLISGEKFGSIRMKETHLDCRAIAYMGDDGITAYLDEL